MSATKRIVVFGGNGFLGSRICRAAVSRNWDVTSVSRSGPPHWHTSPAWSTSVSWERADIFRPSQWVSLLHNADYVVHSLGILLEADYKGVVSGRESPLAGLRRAFDPAKGYGVGGDAVGNPLRRVRREVERSSGGSQRDEGTGEEDKEGPIPTGAQLTYEMMNRDSTLLLAKEAAKQGVAAFGFISAAAGAPMLPSRYITTKREAEAIVAREFPGMRSVFYRAPLMYDASRSVTMGVAALATAGSVVDGMVGGGLGRVLGSMVTRPMKADAVADAVVEGLADEGVRGAVEVQELERLAERGWRKTML
ncbi:hypothetical protein B0J18DRAFT_450005 [Chaetomium sp. MPI-SDFR-AT-0129]|nr:hypothetical protein B0J18DRAFT_450005 [Chaetomium sp. MPI-SDFR-AT-0129]